MFQRTAPEFFFLKKNRAHFADDLAGPSGDQSGPQAVPASRGLSDVKRLQAEKNELFSQCRDLQLDLDKQRKAYADREEEFRTAVDHFQQENKTLKQEIRDAKEKVNIRVLSSGRSRYVVAKGSPLENFE